MCTCGWKTQELVALAQDGDRSAANQLCGLYADRVRWMVRLRMGKELRAKLESMDLVQETLAQALRGLNDFTYKNEGDFVRWLSKIAENELRGSLRRLHAQKRDMRREARCDSHRSTATGAFAAAPDPIRTTTPSVITSRKEDFARLEKALDALKAEYREAIILAKIEGLSFEQMGARLGKSADAARMLATRAMAALTVAFRRI